MIIIEKPILYKNDDLRDLYRLQASVTDEGRGETFDLYYEIKEAHANYLCDSTADAFLVLILPMAGVSGQDIRVKAPVSAKLLYAVRSIHIPFFAKFYKKQEVKIECDSITDMVLSENGIVGVGCSLGIDSLSSIFGHLGEKCPNGYKVSHLALFNSGHFGSESKEKADKFFEELSVRAGQFAEELNLKTVSVNSNIMDFYKDSGVSRSNSAIYNDLCCALALQKLFGKYIYASNYSSEDIFFDYADARRCEGLLVPNLSTDSCQIILADTFATRTQKTDFVSRSSLSKKYLTVCWSEQVSNLPCSTTRYLKKGKMNCGWCDKCLCTLLTLEILGRLDDYSEIFDLQNYYRHRKDFIIKVVSNSQYNIFYKEIYDLMIQKKFPIPKIAYLLKAVGVKDSRLLAWLWHQYKHIRYGVKY